MSIVVSLLTAGTNNHLETSENANAVATDFVNQGVIGAITNTSGVAPSTGAFAVNAQGTPDMTVAVTAGVAYVTGTPNSQNSQTLRVRMSANQNVTISANASGSTKFDWVYIQLDATKMATPGVNADDVGALVTSRSSNSTTDDGTPPTYGYLIAVVTVANGASSITNGNIADKRGTASSGFCVQKVRTLTTAVATGTGTIPIDNTIPQISEGTEFMTVTVTPKSATNRLVISANVQLAHNITNGNSVVALYQDSTANALAGNVTGNLASGAPNQVPILHEMAAGTTSQTTFRIRGGNNNACTTTFNGSGGTRLLGAITQSSIIVTEYVA